MRRVVVGATIAGMMMASLVVTAAPASAFCPNEYSIFVRSTSTAGNTNGTRGNLTWFDRDLDPDCEGVAVSTAFMSKGEAGTSDFGTWIEVGWRHRTGCPAPSNYCYFTEKGHGFTPFQNDEYGLSAPTPGTHDVYRITNTPTNQDGSTDWKMQVDGDLDGDFRTLDTYNTQWHTGVAYGETSALGNDTGMRDEQRVLQFKNDSGAWNAWPNNNCQVDTSSGWDWDRVSDHAHDVIHDGQNC
ncbi:MAG: hypothetical protein ABI635_00740 [Actinomycetota bacterium]